MIKKSKFLTPLALVIGLVSGIAIAILLSSAASADKCIQCYGNGGGWRDGGDRGMAIAADAGRGHPCLAIIIGDSCVDSTDPPFL